MKKLILMFLLLAGTANAQIPELGQAKGLFMAVGVGPRVPIGRFGDVQNLGVGFDFSFSYTDNQILPIFVYSTLGYEHYPGRQDYYKVSDHTALSSNVIMLKFGVRYYLPPIFDEVVLLMPVIEAGPSFALYEKFHQYKIETGKNNVTEDNFKSGFHAGIGVSMFILDAIFYYNYLHDSQYISFDLKVRIPIFATI
ncbi:MAG: hypothetical protein KJ571_17270 [Bacteroidetes bacterium]|nr:hypothetical protein [Bacteroidota bacterium]